MKQRFGKSPKSKRFSKKQVVAHGRRAYKSLAEKIVSKRVPKSHPAYRAYVSIAASFINSLVEKENAFFIQKGAEILDSLDVESLALSAMSAAYKNISGTRFATVPGVFELHIYNCGIVPDSSLPLEDPEKIIYFKQEGKGASARISRVSPSKIKNSQKHFLPINLSKIAFDSLNISDSCQNISFEEVAEVVVYRSIASTFGYQAAGLASAYRLLPSKQPGYHVPQGTWEDYCFRAFISHAALNDLSYSGKIRAKGKYAVCVKKAVLDEQSDAGVFSGKSPLLKFAREEGDNDALEHAAQEYLAFLRERFEVLDSFEESNQVIEKVFGTLSPDQLLAISNGEEFISQLWSDYGAKKKVSKEFKSFVDSVSADVLFVLEKVTDSYEQKLLLLLEEIRQLDKKEGARSLKKVNSALKRARIGIREGTPIEKILGPLATLRAELNRKLVSLQKQKHYINSFEKNVSEAKSIISELDSEVGLSAGTAPIEALLDVKTISSTEIDLIEKDSLSFASTLEKMARETLEPGPLKQFLSRLDDARESAAFSSQMAKRFVKANKKEDAVMALQEGTSALDDLYSELMREYSSAEETLAAGTEKVLKQFDLVVPEDVTLITNSDLATRHDLQLLQINSIINSLTPLPGIPRLIAEWAAKKNATIYQFKGQHKYYLGFDDYEKCNEFLKKKGHYSIARLVADAQEELSSSSD